MTYYCNDATPTSGSEPIPSLRCIFLSGAKPVGTGLGQTIRGPRVPEEINRRWMPPRPTRWNFRVVVCGVCGRPAFRGVDSYRRAGEQTSNPNHEGEGVENLLMTNDDRAHRDEMSKDLTFAWLAVAAQ